MIGDYTEMEIEDSRARGRAQVMAGRLAEYARHRDLARAAERREQPEAARLFRADARAALHMYPELLAMVEPQDDAPVLVGLVERVREWTGR